ncbi:unnamed protein product [Lepidochelys olivacea]
MKEALQLFERYHDSLLGGLLGIFKTRNMLTSKYYWPGMTKDIANWVARCLSCQKEGKELNLDSTLKSIKFNLYICERLRIERSSTSPYHPQTNGLAENANKSIKRALRKMVDDYGSNWDELLDPILFSLRTKVHATTKISPFQLMFCADPVFPEEVSENYTIPDVNTFGEDFCKEYSINMKSRHDADIALALSNISKAQEKQQRHYAKRKNSKYGEITFDVGDSVLLLNARKRTRKGGILEPRYRGPYKITTVEGKRVKLQTISGKRLGTMYSIAHLKPFKEPPTLAAESTSEGKTGTEIAVGDTEPETPTEEIRKVDGTVSYDSTVKNRGHSNGRRGVYRARCFKQ